MSRVHEAQQVPIGSHSAVQRSMSALYTSNSRDCTEVQHLGAGHHQENVWDTLLMLWHSPALSAVNAAFVASVVGLNVFGLLVTASLGSVFRAVLMTTRTASVCPAPRPGCLWRRHGALKVSV